LSGGAIAGIIVGAILALVLLGAAMFLFRRKRRESPSAPGEEVWQKPELDGKTVQPTEVAGQSKVVEMDVPASELEGDTPRPVELDSLAHR
jgi:hypothetical protein